MMDDNYIAKLIQSYRLGLVTAEELISILERRLYAIIKQ
jgi:hypothetical protein